MDQNVKELATKLLRTGYNDLPERVLGELLIIT